MTKRDDDSVTNGSADIEAGMTTAERRRRRRGRGGLRVPSDNVPRRTTTPPVVAPVPEDPSLAMSIAYSFSSDGSEPVPRVSASDVPGFGDPSAPEAMQTVIDPPSSPVDSTDFEMKTREMSAVDLDALGLAEHASPVAGPVPSPGMMDASELQMRFRGQVKPRAVTEPTLINEVPVAPPQPKPVQLAPGMVKTQPMPLMRASTEPIVEPPTRPNRAVTDAGSPTTPAVTPRERLRTMALSDEDLLEVREAAARALTGNPNKGASLSPSPSVTPAAAPVVVHAAPAVAPSMVAPSMVTHSTMPLSVLDIDEDKPEPISVSDIDINDLADRAEASGEFDVDIEEQEPLQPVPQAAAVTPPPAVPSGDRRSRPPSAPPPATPVPGAHATVTAHAAHAPP
ncbi:MAG: hypothetical protein H0T42_19105, partial [Deltaproteobacteria bacterium]|nr:hypothetical protein [Deltaproteobacteria bacterium]